MQCSRWTPVLCCANRFFGFALFCKLWKLDILSSYFFSGFNCEILTTLLILTLQEGLRVPFLLALSCCSYLHTYVSFYGINVSGLAPRGRFISCVYSLRGLLGCCCDNHLVWLWKSFGWHAPNVNVELNSQDYIQDYLCNYHTSWHGDTRVYLHEKETLVQKCEAYCNVQERVSWPKETHSTKVKFISFFVVVPVTEFCTGRSFHFQVKRAQK